MRETAPRAINITAIAPNIMPRFAIPLSMVIGFTLARACIELRPDKNIGLPIAINKAPIAVIAKPPATKAEGLIPTTAPRAIDNKVIEPRITAKLPIPFKNVLGLNLDIRLREFKAVSKVGELIGIKATLKPAIAIPPRIRACGLIEATPPTAIATKERPVIIIPKFIRPLSICLGFN